MYYYSKFLKHYDWPEVPWLRRGFVTGSTCGVVFAHKIGMDDQVDGRWSCSDSQLEAYAQAHVRAGLALALDILNTQENNGNSLFQAVGVFKKQLTRHFEMIDEHLDPLIEAERKVAEEKAAAAWAESEKRPIETHEAYEQRMIAYGVVKADCANRLPSSSGWRCECHRRHGAEFLNQSCDYRPAVTHIMEGRIPDAQTPG